MLEAISGKVLMTIVTTLQDVSNSPMPCVGLCYFIYLNPTCKTQENENEEFYQTLGFINTCFKVQLDQ